MFVKIILGFCMVLCPAVARSVVFYPDVDLATYSYCCTGWGYYTVGHDPSTNWDTTPLGTVNRVRIKADSAPSALTVRLYSNPSGRSLVASSATGGPTSLGSNVYEYILSSPFDVTSGNQMLATVLTVTVYVDNRLEFNEKYGVEDNKPTNTQQDRFTAIQYVYGTPPTATPTPTRTFIDTPTVAMTASLTPTAIMTPTVISTAIMTPTAISTATKMVTPMPVMTPTLHLPLVLSTNVFNPLSESLRIDVLAKASGWTVLSIYNLLGEKVLEVAAWNAVQGQSYSFTWGGRSRVADLVGSGVYMVTIETPEGATVKKIMVLRR